MRRPFRTWIAWALAGLVSLFCFYQVSQYLLVQAAQMGLVELIDHLLWLIFPIVFAFPAALILSKQPRHTIGWLLMFPAFLTSLPVSGSAIFNVSQTPQSPSALFLLAVWFDDWSWILLIFPILMIPLLFPTGRPPSRRWRWVIYYAIGMALVFVSLVTFSENLTPLNIQVDWSVRNPLGFLPYDLFNSDYFSIFWQISLIGLTLTCILALIVRFRRAGQVERAQIKWLLFACFVFGICYIGAGLSSDTYNLRSLVDILFVLSLMLLPLAIANAILRYHLFDIDVIIRKTLIYGLLTGFLGLIFFGSVVLFQELSTLVLSANSPAAVVISTLMIAALFAPLRNRVQAFIDRRFYRQKYDHDKLLSAFAYRTQTETDLQMLSDHLLEVVSKTMQPVEIGLWIRLKK